MTDSAETRLLGPWTRTGNGLPAAASVTAACAAAVTAVLAATALRADGASIVADALGFALAAALGLFRLARDPHDRFAWLLVAASVVWAASALSLSTGSVAYSVGRTAVWIVQLGVIYLMLAFPLGRLTTRIERRLMVAAGAIVGGLYLPTVLFAQFPSPAPWAGCGTSCPSNAFTAITTSSAFVEDFVRPVRELLTVVVYAGAAAILVARTQRGSRLLRRATAPVALIALAQLLAITFYLAARRAGPTSATADVMGNVYMFAFPAAILAFIAGFVSERLFVATALERLARGLRPHSSAAELRTTMAWALADPSLQLVYWLPDEPGQWVDGTGRPVTPPRDERGRAVTDVRLEGRLLATIVHDIELERDPSLVRAATAYALTALENGRLLRELSESMNELSESRARLVAVADDERRKIERDLHDGAQQRLVALRVKLELAAEQVEDDAPGVAARLRKLERDVDEAIDEVRAFARGVYPALLADRGLGEALRAAGTGATIPTIVDAGRVGRYPAEVEATVYFACVEALQNAAKHARGANGVSISVTDNGGIEFEVRDDGCGFDPEPDRWGTGLTHIRDRLSAVGGALEVDSKPGRGTRIKGTIAKT